MIQQNEPTSWAMRKWPQCWRDHFGQPSETVRHYYHIFLAIILFSLAQLLTCAWDQPFWMYDVDFPGQIAAMVFVWLAMWAIQVIFFRSGEGLEGLYHRHLRAPTDILNKQMSIGFTVPFLNLISQPFAGADQVGLLTAAFVVTGILNAIFVYAVAYHVQLCITNLPVWVSWPYREAMPRIRTLDLDLDLENLPQRYHTSVGLDLEPSRFNQPSVVDDGADHDATVCAVRDSNNNSNDKNDNHHEYLNQYRKHTSDTSTLCTLSGYVSDSNGWNTACLDVERAEGLGQREGQPADALRTGLKNSLPPPMGEANTSTLGQNLRTVAGVLSKWIRRNIFLTSSILLFLLLGLPLSYLHDDDLCMDIGFLFTVWLTFTSAQTRVKKYLALHPDRKSLVVLATLLNPVLWTSLFLLCYGLAKSHIRGESTSAIVARFKTNNTISDLIAHHIDVSNLSNTSTPSSSSSSSSSSTPILIGAGDIAASILNAGIVTWGLKLFEYRRHVLSRGGLTVLLTSATTALAGVVVWPLVARGIGVRPAASDLSFAARSVTIALGGPVMGSLGGDAAVNAVGVVVNGLCFQLLAGAIVGGRDGGVFEGFMMALKKKIWKALSGEGWIGKMWKNGVSGSGGGRGGGRGGGDEDEYDENYRAKSASPDDDEKDQRHNELGETNERGQHQKEEREFKMGYSSDTTHTNDKQRQQSTPAPLNEDHDTNHHNTNTAATLRRHQPPPPTEDTADISTVAAGVTIGINAAAMGTAHLYEQNSHAAPYSALSMTTFGVFTVLFTVQSPMVEWLVGMVRD